MDRSSYLKWSRIAAGIMASDSRFEDDGCQKAVRDHQSATQHRLVQSRVALLDLWRRERSVLTRSATCRQLVISWHHSRLGYSEIRAEAGQPSACVWRLVESILNFSRYHVLLLLIRLCAYITEALPQLSSHVTALFS